MEIFIRRKTAGDRYSVWHNLNEYVRTFNIQFRDFVLTANVDCPQGLENGQVRLYANTGLKLDGIINTLDNLGAPQINMLHQTLPSFMGWLDNSRYERKENYVYYSRLKMNDTDAPIWVICNILELDSQESLIQGILDLSAMASAAIIEINNSNIPFINNQQLFDTQIRNRIDIIKDFLTYCRS